MNELELWIPIPNYEGVYEISSFGRVRSLDRTIIRNGVESHIKGTIMRTHDNGHGYLAVVFKKNGITKSFYIHRLVASAFVPNPNGYKEINHIDEDKKNNNANNLEWCTRIYNLTYGNRINIIANKKINHPCCSRRVACYSLTNALIKEYPSAAEAARQTGIKASSIINCCRNTRGIKKVHNLIFKYLI